MTLLDRMEQLAAAACEKPVSTGVTLTPGELLELCRLARAAQESDDDATRSNP